MPLCENKLYGEHSTILIPWQTHCGNRSGSGGYRAGTAVGIHLARLGAQQDDDTGECADHQLDGERQEVSERESSIDSDHSGESSTH